MEEGEIVEAIKRLKLVTEKMLWEREDEAAEWVLWNMWPTMEAEQGTR